MVDSAAVRERRSTSDVHRRLRVGQVERNLSARGRELDELLQRASARRNERLDRVGRPGVITYSRKVFIPVTTLCRDRCHYCTFVDTPAQAGRKGTPLFMSREQVLAVAAQGARLGCKEALFTLGDRPEDRWPEAREWLAAQGHSSTIGYIAELAQMVLSETGLLPHMNPGVMSSAELGLLRAVSPSMGMMLETTSRDLWLTPGRAHYGSPDKDPSLRLRVLEDAGHARIPFTTGLLIGIGETIHDRAESIVALAEMAERHGHIQEVIIQNFRAKAATAMRASPDAAWDEYLAAVAAARLALGTDVGLQAPPNLADQAQIDELLGAGIDDWGGVSPLTADHVNPERPWPQIDELARRTAQVGFTLTERLTVHPEYVRDPLGWFDPDVRVHVARLADPQTGLALVGSAHHAGAPIPSWSAHVDTTSQILRRAELDPAGLRDRDYAALLEADDVGLAELTRIADDVRRYSVGEYATFVMNRSIVSTGFASRQVPERPAFTREDAREIARDAQQLGLTELCFQGSPDADAGVSAYIDLIAAVRGAAPALHIHAFRAAELVDGARRLGRPLAEFLGELRMAGLGTVTGTGVGLLGGPSSGGTSMINEQEWSRTIVSAHRAGLRSTSVIIYGADESAMQRVRHLRKLADIQDDTGGFTELIPMPTPSGFRPLLADRSALAEHCAMTAVARLLLHGRIGHIQAAWTRVGDDGAVALLRAGADDLGGTLHDGRVRADVSAQRGDSRSPDDLAEIARRAGRGLRQRSTLYGRLDVPRDR